MTGGPTRLVLFDIDGTLVLTGGAGKRAMDRAFADAFGVANAFADVPMGGRTDRYLIERGLERWGMPATAAALEAFRRHYLRHLAESIHEPGTAPRGPCRAWPGCSTPSTPGRPCRRRCSPATTRRARASSSTHFDLWHRFAWGAFGDDHAERDELACAAVAAAAGRGVALADRSHAVIVGDTPFDIACARAAGARVVAVATGGHSLDELQALGPDLAVADLTELDAVLALVDDR